MEPKLLLRTDAYKNAATNDFWVFISDPTGKMLAVKQVRPHDPPLEFYGPSNGNITMTTFGYYQYNSSGMQYDRYYLASVQDIVPGSEFILDTAYYSGSYPDVIGKASIRLEDYNDANDPYFSLYFQDGYSPTNFELDLNSMVYQGSTFSADFQLRKNPIDVLVVSYRNGMPVYQWLQNVRVGDVVTTSFLSFQESKTISLNKQVAYGYVGGLNGNQIEEGYYILSNLGNWLLSKSSDKSQIPKLGYIDGFEKYLVEVYQNPLGATETNVTYNKLGSLPQSIEMPEYSLSITNNNLLGFSFKFSNEYTYKSSLFQTDFNPNAPTTYVTWNFTASNKENFAVPSIPKEILQHYPTFSVSNLKFSWMNIYHELDGQSYQDCVRQLITSHQRDTYENLNYSILKHE